MIYFVAAIAAIAGFLFGFDEGIIAGAEESLMREFPMTSIVQGFMTAAVPLGALAGAVAAGRLADRYGRRRMLMAASLVFLAGTLIAATASGVAMLTAARVLLGIAIGVAGMVAPLYISETSDAARRGGFVAAYQLAVTLGILASYLIDYALDEGGGWRWMFACGLVPATALLAGSLALPESPRWLALRGHHVQAGQILTRLRGGDSAAAQRELAEIEAVSGEQQAGSWRELAGRRLRPAMIAALGLYVLQQLSGINAIIYYAPIIFKNTGFESQSAAILATAGVGTINVLMTIVAMQLVDRLGRRRLLFMGLGGATLSLGVIAASVAWGADTGAISAVALMAYVGAFAISLGPIPHIMMSEVFPLALRSKGMGLASATNWGCNFLVVLIFPVALGAVGIAPIMGFFAVVCALGIIFTLRFVPETKGVPLEEIEQRLDQGRLVTTN